MLTSRFGKLRLAPDAQRVRAIRDENEIDVFEAGTWAWKEKVLNRLDGARTVEELKDIIYDLILRSP